MFEAQFLSPFFSFHLTYALPLALLAFFLSFSFSFSLSLHSRMVVFLPGKLGMNWCMERMKLIMALSLTNIISLGCVLIVSYDAVILNHNEIPHHFN